MPFAFREEVICTKMFASKYSQPVPSPFLGRGGAGGVLVFFVQRLLVPSVC